MAPQLPLVRARRSTRPLGILVKDRHIHAGLLGQSLEAQAEANVDALWIVEELTEQVNEEMK